MATRKETNLNDVKGNLVPVVYRFKKNCLVFAPAD
jgi:hypothetical protein